MIKLSQNLKLHIQKPRLGRRPPFNSAYAKHFFFSIEYHFFQRGHTYQTGLSFFSIFYSLFFFQAYLKPTRLRYDNIKE